RSPRSRSSWTGTKKGGEHARTQTPSPWLRPPAPALSEPRRVAPATGGVPARPGAGDRRRRRRDQALEVVGDARGDDRRLGGLAAPLRAGPNAPLAVAILVFTTFHRLGEMGARRPFFVRSEVPNVYDKERTLQRDISGKVEEALPGVEV